MKLLMFLLCVFVLHVGLANCFPSDDISSNEAKTVNGTETSTFQKVKDGVRSFGSKVSGVAVKGYEELKNLFSSDRKVGDYQLQNIDVRVRDEDDYEEVGVRRRTRRKTYEKRDELMSHHVAADIDEIMKDILALQTTRGPKHSLSLENNAEIEPGLPPQFAIIRVPLICPKNEKYIRGKCRTLE